MRMVQDDSGQFLLLSAVIISLGLVILLIFVNQSSIAGHSSSESIMSFPKNDIRDIRAETVGEVKTISWSLNQFNNSTTGQQKIDTFNAEFARYAADIENLSAEKGCVVDVASVPQVKDKVIDNATVTIYYNNGETMYSEDFLVDIS